MRTIRSFCLAAILAACGNGRAGDEVAVFEPGDENDPVVKMALTTPTTKSALGAVANGTSFTFAQGLVSNRPLFTVGSAPSAALSAYLASGDAEKLAKDLNLVLGTDAQVVPVVGPGEMPIFNIDAPVGTKLSYVARIGTTQDFVGVRDQALFDNSNKPVFIDAAVGGYKVASGLVASGNSQTGATASNTHFYGMSMADCSWGNIPFPITLFHDDFNTGKADNTWPKNVGYSGDFNGDWYHDGTTVRFYNPSWPGADPAAPKPTVSGFVKFIDICPAPSAKLSLSAGVNTAYTDIASDTTLVLYFFDQNNALLSTAANYPLRGGNQRTHALYDATIPNGTRRVAIVPMAYISSPEQNTVFYSHLDVQYETNGWYTTKSIVSDNFSSYGNSATYGGNQPTGWAEFGGDWFALASGKWATLWNAKWGGDQSHLPPVDTGLTKNFSLGNYAKGDTLSARAFAALTFTDKTSFVRLRFVFDKGSPVETDRLYGNTWNALELRRVAIPSGARNVTVIVNAYLGPTETSSLYVDDLSVFTTHANN